MIAAAYVMPLLVQACPSFEPAWQLIRVDDYHVNDDGSRLHYIDAGEFARHLVGLYEADSLPEVRRAFQAIEQLHVDGDEYVRELATIGYLESIQGAVQRSPACAPDDLTPFLGAESRLGWNGLNAFWSGQAPAVSAASDVSAVSAAGPGPSPTRSRPWWRRRNAQPGGNGPR